MEQTTFISVDLEADGAIIGVNSLLSIGMCALNEEGEVISTFYRTLEPIPGGVKEERCTEEFWSKHPERLREATTDPEPIEKVLNDFIDWRNTLPSGPQWFIAKPTVYDGAWLSYYLTRFTTYSSFKLRWLDLGTFKFALYTMGSITNKLKSEEGRIVKDNPFPHNALWDAVEQGDVFMLYYQALKKATSKTLKELLKLE